MQCVPSGAAGALLPGQVYCDTGTNIPASGTGLPSGVSAGQIPGGLQRPAGYTGPTTLSAGSATPQAPNGYEWASIINQSGQTLLKVLAVSQGGSAVTLPNGMSMVYGSPQAAAGAGAVLTSTTAAFGNVMPFLLAGVGLFVVFSMMGGGGGRYR